MAAGFAREEDDAGAVVFQASDVQGEGFGGEVGPAGVDADANCGREFTGDAGFLFFSWLVHFREIFGVEYGGLLYRMEILGSGAW